MPIKIHDVDYLNTTEARKYLGWSQQTFQKYTKDLKRITVLGKHGVWFRQDDLEEFKQFLPLVVERK